MTKEQMAWAFYAWMLIPSTLELIAIVALISVATIPSEKFESKNKILLASLGAVLLIPLLTYLSTLAFHDQFHTLSESTLNAPIE